MGWIGAGQVPAGEKFLSSKPTPPRMGWVKSNSNHQINTLILYGSVQIAVGWCNFVGWAGFCPTLNATKHIDELIAFYNWCKDTGVARSLEYLDVQRITRKLNYIFP